MEKQDAHNTLIGLRRQCDQLKLDGDLKQKKVDHFKEDLDRLDEEQKFYKGEDDRNPIVIQKPIEEENNQLK